MIIPKDLAGGMELKRVLATISAIEEQEMLERRSRVQLVGGPWTVLPSNMKTNGYMTRFANLEHLALGDFTSLPHMHCIRDTRSRLLVRIERMSAYSILRVCSTVALDRGGGDRTTTMLTLGYFGEVEIQDARNFLIEGGVIATASGDAILRPVFGDLPVLTRPSPRGRRRPASSPSPIMAQPLCNYPRA